MQSISRMEYKSLTFIPIEYPYYQKKEIDKIVSEMMHAGIIRLGTSSYSILYVDYRALNKLTIPDKFCILIIDELG